ncbi:MAG: hypothetical protein OEW19_03385, partial [Acidobacteriota bacterium]|nr:hypothetical protein [Acidobacteriota bacterium]
MTARFLSAHQRVAIVAIVACEMLVASVVAMAQTARDGFDPGADASVYALVVQPDGKTIVAGDFTRLGGGGTGTVTRHRIGRLNADGSIDDTFDPGANGRVHAVALQPDGKILVAGLFTGLGGGVGTTPRPGMGRLHPDGSVDLTFNPQPDGPVADVAVQQDGRVLIVGSFTTLGSGPGAVPRRRIARLAADGAVDPGFNPGADAAVTAIDLQPDGRILIGGDFSAVGGGAGTTVRRGIARLNADGAIDPGFDPGANDAVWAFARQADGRIVVGGPFTTLGGGGTGTAMRSHLGRLSADGALDEAFNPGVDDDVAAVVLQPDGRILVMGAFTAIGGGGTGATPRARVARLQLDGAVDPGFDPGANVVAHAVAVQPDGKIVVGGSFTLLGGGGTGTAVRHHIGRLYADGSLDADLDPMTNGRASVQVQPDGKLVLYGTFTTLGGGTSGTITRHHLARLDAGGSVDLTFDPGANGNVTTLAIQPDGRILVAGDFTLLGGGTGSTPRNGLGRLQPDGSIDPTFDPAAGRPVRLLVPQPDGKVLVAGFFDELYRLNADGSIDVGFQPLHLEVFYRDLPEVKAVELQADGKILVGGYFDWFVGNGGRIVRSNILRLHPDGSLDASFNPGAGNIVYGLAVQADGKIFAGGFFGAIGGGLRCQIARLNADGSLDASFDAGAGCGPLVGGLALQADARLVITGTFTDIGGHRWIARLQANGTVDHSFDPGLNDLASGATLQPDGKVLLSGNFTMLGGGGTGTVPRNRFGRLTTFDPALEQLAVLPGGTTVRWARSGAGPEVWRATFEASTDGVTFVALGSGEWLDGEWSLTGLSLPVGQTVYVRARGYYSRGSIVESVRLAHVAPEGSIPRISAVGDQVIVEDDTTGPLAVTVGDAETAPSMLALTAVSSNPALVPASGLTLGGGGSARTVDVTPAPNQFGVTTITLVVRDAESNVATTSFTVTVTAVNDPPTITVPPPQTIGQGQSTAVLPVTVDDVESPASDLTLTAVASNPQLVPPAGLVLGSGGATRTLVVTPYPAQTGHTIVTLTVVDAEGGRASGSLTLSVEPTSPSVPWGLEGTVDGSLVDLRWQPPTGGPVSGYVVDAGPSPGVTSVSLPTGGTTPAFSAIAPVQATWYVRVRAVGAGRPGAPSNEIAFDTMPVPSRPRNLTVSLTGRTATLTWEVPATGAEGYQLEAGSAPGLHDVAVAQVGAMTTVVVADVPVGTFYLRARARNAADVGGASNEVVLTYPATPPGPPEQLAAAVSGSTVVLTWQPAATGGAPDGYVLEAGTSAGGTEIGT